MTVKLFDDGGLTEFEAGVVSCLEAKGGYEVVLDRSAFFPEGGGQPGDVGVLNEVAVLDTYEKDGEVIHLCAEALIPGSHIYGRIDKDIRLRRMQNHSGEHLLMGIIHNKFGYDNVGFRLGSGAVTLDLNGIISEEELKECEQLANEAIAEDIPITVSYPDRDELAGLNYRSKIEASDKIRIVTIEGIDRCACCAPHLSSTGKIGIIKVLSSEKNRGGTRVFIVCGLDALDVFRQREKGNSEISRLLSAKPELTAEAVKRLHSEVQNLKERLAEAERLRTDDIIKGLDNPSRGSFGLFVEGLNADHARRIANAAVSLTDGAAGIFYKAGEGYSYVIASRNIPLRERVKEINAALKGKGGGSDMMLQGTATASREEIDEFFSSFH